MNLAHNVCPDYFLFKFETGALMTYMSWSSDFINFYSLGQFLSNYRSYSSDTGTCIHSSVTSSMQSFIFDHVS